MLSVCIGDNIGGKRHASSQIGAALEVAAAAAIAGAAAGQVRGGGSSSGSSSLLHYVLVQCRGISILGEVRNVEI